MEKSHLFGNRGARRWESRKKWFRRLRSDWNDHWEGWPPKYEWKDGKLCYISPGDPTQLCGCFNLSDPQALRFKDTPRPCSCLGCGGNPRRLLDGRKKSRESCLTLAERKVGLKDNWSKRRRRVGRHPQRLICRKCGYLLKIIMLENNGQGRYHHMGGLKCPGCKEKH